MYDISFVIITGLSGAGKSEAVRAFEDIGYFCVDNLPATLIPKFAEVVAQSDGKINKIALVVDIRGRDFFDGLMDSIDNLDKLGINYEILFLECSDEALIRRFKETRRKHPLAEFGGILDGINSEREKLGALKQRATKIIDTSSLSARELKNKVAELFSKKPDSDSMNISVVSFGFKYGVPMDADLVFDVRFLPNPYWVDSLKTLTGRDKPVKEYVMKWPVTQRFLEKVSDMLEFLIPNYIKEGRTHLIIAIGCTGGKHRSVTLANIIADYLGEKGYQVSVDHRDVEAG